MVQQPFEEEDITGKFLFENENVKETKGTVQKFRKLRENKIKVQ